MSTRRIIGTKTKCDLVVDDILSMICKGEYSEGEKLPSEKYFTEFYGVSRVTIRESIKKLSVLGVIDVVQGEGTYVKQIDMGVLLKPLYSVFALNELNINQLFTARKFIESGMARLAAVNRTPDDVIKMNELLDEMGSAINDTDTDRFYLLDIKFHVLIAGISGNRLLRATYDALYDILTSYIKTSNSYRSIVIRSYEQHKQIVSAIVSQDEFGAGAEMESHIESVMISLIEHVGNQAG